ncbi:hypothetical protein CYMTET_56535 [Cymbomonas tetramitiformis]|uniref:Uncharacterized protein n=1 Tax=Cymbomonas tetramitiformis TaxID=36881 RepID=A0AAE0ENN2_9CHLO|nr:hypothetical protein CYMTET_56535 [Cymbomonas tetramitiformis]
MPHYNLTDTTVDYAARRRSARVNEDLLPAGDLLGVTYSGSCAFHGKDVVVVQSPLTNPFVEIACVETGALKTTAAAKSAASRREKSKATKKRERDDAEDEERVKKAKAQEEQQQRDDKKVQLAEEKARLTEEKARKMEKALAGVVSAAHVKHAVENTEKKIEQAVLLREHEMKVGAAEAERKRSAEVVEELRQQLQKQLDHRFRFNTPAATDAQAINTPAARTIGPSARDQHAAAWCSEPINHA